MKKNLILAGVMAAMICLATFLHITVGISGYIHLGDAVIYLAAALLPNPYAAAAAAVGAGLADVLVAPVWAPFTVAIKAVMVFCFTAKKDRILCRRNLLAPWFAGLVCIGGYYVAETVILMLSGTLWQAAFIGAVAGIPFNTVQVVGCGIAYIALGAAWDRLNLKKRLQRLGFTR